MKMKLFLFIFGFSDNLSKQKGKSVKWKSLYKFYLNHYLNNFSSILQFVGWTNKRERPIRIFG